MGWDPDKSEKGMIRTVPLGTQSSRGTVLTSQSHTTTFPPLQLALNIGNTRFNEVMEAQLPSHGCPKPSAESDM